MDWLSVFVLAIVQGITEWIPVSSSGHLVLFEQLFNLSSSVFFDTMLHFSSLLAVVIIFFEDIKAMFLAVLFWKSKSDHFKLFWFIVLGTIPIALIGFFFRSFIEASFSSLLVVGLSLLFTSFILWLTKYVTGQNNYLKKNISVHKENKFNKHGHFLNIKSALIIGLAQIFALLPGVSRSGITISFGLFLGLSKDDSARFSFLLFLPAVFGAFLLQLTSVSFEKVVVLPVLLGMVSSFVVSVLVLNWLLGVVKRGKLHYFSWYCLFLGLFLVLFSLL